MRKVQKFLVKIISCALVVIVGYQPLNVSAEPGEFVKKFYNIELPSEIGSVEQRWLGNTDKLLVLIQDSHVSLEVQLNIAEIIQLLVNEYGLNLVNIEGADHERIDFDELRNLEPKEIVERVSIDFLKESRINGAVYAKINNEKDFIQYGTEDREAYLENYKHYLAVVENNQKLLEEIKKIRDVMMRNKEKLISKELIEFINIEVLFRDGDTELLYYFKRVIEYSQKLKIELIEYPMIYNLIEIALSEDDAGNFKTVDNKKLLDEMAILNDAIKAKLATDVKAKNFVNLLDKILSLEEILKLRVLQTDFERYQKDKSGFEAIGFSQAVQRVFPKWDVSELFHLDKVLKDADKFYEVAHDRSFIMLENSLENMENEKEIVSVVVSGGYHTEALVELCREKDIGYLRVMPTITSAEETVDYEGRMLELKAELLGGSSESENASDGSPATT